MQFHENCSDYKKWTKLAVRDEWIKTCHDESVGNFRNICVPNTNIIWWILKESGIWSCKKNYLCRLFWDISGWIWDKLPRIVSANIVSINKIRWPRHQENCNIFRVVRNLRRKSFFFQIDMSRKTGGFLLEQTFRVPLMNMVDYLSSLIRSCVGLSRVICEKKKLT